LILTEKKAPFVIRIISEEEGMEKKILIASNSDITLNALKTQLKTLEHVFDVKWVSDLTEVTDVNEYTMTVVDLSIYAVGILDAVAGFKIKHPNAHLIGLTYTNDECIDQLLIGKGIDQVTCSADLYTLLQQNFAQHSATQKITHNSLS
jgi:hypothetical protein